MITPKNLSGLKDLTGLPLLSLELPIFIADVKQISINVGCVEVRSISIFNALLIAFPD